MPKHSDTNIEKCIVDCNRCIEACNDTLNHCMQIGGKHADSIHLNLLADCIEICKLNLDFMDRKSEHAKHICRECAEICNRCAQSCDEIDPNDAQMEECATICRDCADSCQIAAESADDITPVM